MVGTWLEGEYGEDDGGDDESTMSNNDGTSGEAAFISPEDYPPYVKNNVEQEIAKHQSRVENEGTSQCSSTGRPGIQEGCWTSVLGGEECKHPDGVE